MAPRPGTTEALASYLTTGYFAAKGKAATQWDLDAGEALSVDLSGLTGAGRHLARAALDAWEAVADVRFRETTGRADIAFGDAQAGAHTTRTYNARTGEMGSAAVNVAKGWLDAYGDEVGGYAFQTYLHEIGHALGLGHSGTYEAGATYRNATWANDSWQATVMSYLDQDENPNVRAAKAYVVTPMSADIDAVQALYGAPRGGATAGDTTYGHGATVGNYLKGVFGRGEGDLGRNALTVFDEGGTDRFDFSDTAAAQAIDLNGGALSSVRGQVDNLAIARGTVIERADGGRGADTIFGNRAANTLNGNDGADRIEGRDGRDAIRGDAGDDSLHGGPGDDRVWGGSGRDSLKGGGGGDTLHGGQGRDTLSGGSGDDTLHGGGDGDAFVFAGGSDVVADFQNNVDTLRLDAGLWGGGDRSADRILDLAHRDGGDVVLDFGHGNVLRLLDVGSIGLLADDLAIA